METLKQYIVYGFLLMSGASGWIMLETTHVAPPVCVVTQEAYDLAPPPRAKLDRGR